MSDAMPAQNGEAHAAPANATGEAHPAPATATGPTQGSPGWREVLLVAAVVVAVVLGAAVVTGLLPTSVQRVVFHEPLLIGFLILGTILVLWSVSRRRPHA